MRRRRPSPSRRIPPGVETAEGVDTFDDAGTLNWRDSKFLRAGRRPDPDRLAADADAPVDAAFLAEEHHRQYGRPWLLGRYAFDHLVELGLQPSDRLLDVGCGALRLGIHAIRYLDAGHYCGVDLHLKSLEAAVTYELPLHGLEERRPRFLWDDRYRLDHFGEVFDWAIDFSTSLHAPVDDLPLVFGNIARVVRPGGRVLVSPRLRVSETELAEHGLRRADQSFQDCPLLEGHDFKSTIEWWLLERS